MGTLAHALVTAPGATPTRWVLFLHGIFGSGSNWRGVARRFVAARPSWGAALVDLRMHGRSQAGFAEPHTIAGAAADLHAFAPLVPGPVRGVLGHSFGGKVALDYAASREGDLDVAWIVDSTPSARQDARGSESTVHVLEILESLPKTFATRAAFSAAMAEAGVSAPTTEWLAMNVERHGDALRLRLDLEAIRALLEDYFYRDMWSILEHPTGTVSTHLIVGGRSSVFNSEDQRRAQAAALSHPGRVAYHFIADAGHWVHVDAPDALLEILTSTAGAEGEPGGERA